MQKFDEYTGEWQCKCGEWINHPGLCDECQKTAEMMVEEYLLREE